MTLGEEQALVAAQVHFSQAIGGQAVVNERASDERDDMDEVRAEMEAAPHVCSKFRGCGSRLVIAWRVLAAVFGT